jgi:hypothetical protein
VNTGVSFRAPLPAADAAWIRSRDVVYIPSVLPTTLLNLGRATNHFASLDLNGADEDAETRA